MIQTFDRILKTLCVFSVLFLIGCSGSDETKKDETSKEQSGEFKKTDADVAPPVPKTTIPPEAEVKKTEQDIPSNEKDLPKDVPANEPEIRKPKIEEYPTQQPPSTQKTAQIMWSVQIGAFKNESGALQAANEARAKFNQPIYKDLDPVTGFYKVTVGSFATHDQASRFKLEVQSKGYPDAFPVEVRR